MESSMKSLSSTCRDGKSNQTNMTPCMILLHHPCVTFPTTHYNQLHATFMYSSALYGQNLTYEDSLCSTLNVASESCCNTCSLFHNLDTQKIDLQVIAVCVHIQFLTFIQKSWGGQGKANIYMYKIVNRSKSSGCLCKFTFLVVII